MEARRMLVGEPVAGTNRELGWAERVQSSLLELNEPEPFGETSSALLFFHMPSVGEVESVAFRFPTFLGGGSSSSESIVKSITSPEDV